MALYSGLRFSVDLNCQVFGQPFKFPGPLNVPVGRLLLSEIKQHSSNELTRISVSLNLCIYFLPPVVLQNCPIESSEADGRED